MHVCKHVLRISLTSFALNIRRDFAKGAHVVIRLLLCTYNCSIDLHKRNPSSHIPRGCVGLSLQFMRTSHQAYALAFSIQRDFAKGSHDVIFSLSLAYNYPIDMHKRKLSSHMPHGNISPSSNIQFACNMQRVRANGAHVVIFGLQLASKYFIFIHNTNPLSPI